MPSIPSSLNFSAPNTPVTGSILIANGNLLVRTLWFAVTQRCFFQNEMAKEAWKGTFYLHLAWLVNCRCVAMARQPNCLGILPHLFLPSKSTLAITSQTYLPCGASRLVRSGNHQRDKCSDFQMWSAFQHGFECDEDGQNDQYSRNQFHSTQMTNFL